MKALTSYYTVEPSHRKKCIPAFTSASYSCCYILCFLWCSAVMPFKCCVVDCNDYDSQSETVSMFVFPVDSKLHEKWLQNLHRDDLKCVSEIKNSMPVCSKHFICEDFKISTTRRRLKPGHESIRSTTSLQAIE